MSVEMDRLCHDFLACAGLSHDQDGGIGLDDPLHPAEDLLHCRRGADNVAEFEFVPELLFQVDVFVEEPPFFHGLTDDDP